MATEPQMIRSVMCHVNQETLRFIGAVLEPIPEVQLLGGVTSASCLIEFLQRNEVDICVIASQWMVQRVEAIELAREVGVKLPKCVIATTHLTGALCLDAALAKVDDVLDARNEVSESLDRIRHLLRGGSAYVEGQVIPKVWLRDLPSLEDAIHDIVDAHIVKHLLHGASNIQIAEDVFLSVQTVNNRISQMIKRTHSKNRTELAMLFTQLSAIPNSIVPGAPSTPRS